MTNSEIIEAYMEKHAAFDWSGAWDKAKEFFSTPTGSAVGGALAGGALGGLHQRMFVPYDRRNYAAGILGGAGLGAAGGWGLHQWLNRPAQPPTDTTGGPRDVVVPHKTKDMGMGIKRDQDRMPTEEYDAALDEAAKRDAYVANLAKETGRDMSQPISPLEENYTNALIDSYLASKNQDQLHATLAMDNPRLHGVPLTRDQVRRIRKSLEGTEAPAFEQHQEISARGGRTPQEYNTLVINQALRLGNVNDDQWAVLQQAAMDGMLHGNPITPAQRQAIMSAMIEGRLRPTKSTNTWGRGFETQRPTIQANVLKEMEDARQNIAGRDNITDKQVQYIVAASFNSDPKISQYGQQLWNEALSGGYNKQRFDTMARQYQAQGGRAVENTRIAPRFSVNPPRRNPYFEGNPIVPRTGTYPAVPRQTPYPY